MSESHDPPSHRPEDEPPPSTPFPESSLTPPEPPPLPEPSRPHGDPVFPEAPAPLETTPPPQESPPPQPHGDPVYPDAPRTPWLEPSAPEAPAGAAPGAPPSALPSEGGLSSGDPLLGATPAAPSTFPPGYTSPPPPGAGGDYGPPPTPAFGPGAPAGGTLVLAGWWRRAGAALIDGLIISIIAFIIMAPLGVGLFASDGGSDEGFFALIAGFIVGMLVVMVVVFAYAPVMMGRTNGKTVGRMVTGIRVVRAGGEPITIGFAALREVAVKTLLIGTVAGSFTFGLASLLDVLWPLWDDENRALHDFVVNTRTVLDQ